MKAIYWFDSARALQLVLEPARAQVLVQVSRQRVQVRVLQQAQELALARLQLAQRLLLQPPQLPFRRRRCRLQQHESRSVFPQLEMELRCLLCR